MIKEVTFEESKWNDLPWKFEAGTPNISSGIGLGVAVEYLKNVGMNNIKSYTEELGKYALEKLKEVKRISTAGSLRRMKETIGDADILYHGTYVLARHPEIPLLARRYKPALPWEPERIYKEQYIPGVIFGKREIILNVLESFPKEAGWQTFLYQL